MSATINLREVHTRIACVQAECALWQIRRQWERLLATTTDEARRMQIAELLRWDCQKPIRGYHGHFAGCADGGGGSGHMPEGGIHTRGGIKHEIDIDYLQSKKGHDEFMAKYKGPAGGEKQALQAKLGELSLKAEEAARKMGNEDIAALKAHQANLQKLLDPQSDDSLASRVAAMDTESKGYMKLYNEMILRQQELNIITDHLNRHEQGDDFELPHAERRARQVYAQQQYLKSQSKASSSKKASERAPKAGRTKSAKATSTSKASVRESLDDLHAKARALRAKEGLPDEVKPEDLPKNNHGMPIIQPKSDADFATPQDLFGKVNAHDYAKLYGAEKLGVALSQLTHETLRGVAKNEGIDPKNMSKAELVSRITARATNGRYSADYGTKKGTASAKGAGTYRPRSGAGKPARAKFQPIGEASTTKVNDIFAKVSVTEYHRIYGTLQLPSVLGEMTHATLRSLAREWAQSHPEDGEPRLSSKKDIIDYLVKGVVREQGHIGPKTQDELNQVLADRKTEKK